MVYYKWDRDKNARLIETRGVSFEQVVLLIERGEILDILEHPNKEKYPNQKILVVEVEEDVYLVPFVEREDEIFLKTIIPSRKFTKEYLE